MKFITRCKIQCAIYLRFTYNSCSRVVRCELGIEEQRMIGFLL